MLRLSAWTGLAVFLAGCAVGESTNPAGLELGEIPHNAQTGKPLLEVSPNYRSVGYESYGPEVSGLSGNTEVWSADRRWYEEDDASELVWSAYSGLTWDEKYAFWIESLDPVTSLDGHLTVEIETPWGKTLPAPRLECAEMAIFLRATFASWFDLPFYMTAYSSTYGDVHYGHFGIVDNDGDKLSGYPNFALSYDDHTSSFSGQTDAYIEANWPEDADLASKYLTSQKDDAVDFLGTDAYAGAYFDEVYLNKRVGHFMLRLLVNFGSIHLAGGSNVWHIQPEAIREGDVLLNRWQAQGTGHTMVVKDIIPLGNGKIDVEIIFGSMPRIQPKWYETALSKPYFTSKYAGSAELDANGDVYSEFGGGIKRWRTPVVLGDNWVNIVPVDDRAEWIGSTDYPAIEGRIATFESILGDMTPEEERDAILERIEMARDNLSGAPSSCANRERREAAFDELYTHMAAEWGWTLTEVDEAYRDFADYIFAELEYTSSKTCCWNSTTDDMYTIIVEYNTELVEGAHANGQCIEPVVFKARSGGYDPFHQYAIDTGRDSLWVAWSEDESCPQAGVLDDVELAPQWADFCDVYEEVLGLTNGGSSCPNGNQPTSYYADTDYDGYGNAGSSLELCDPITGYVGDSADCDDTDASISPSATEVCDGVDNNCDGDIDEGCNPVDPDEGDTGTTNNTGSNPGGCGCSSMQFGGSFALMLFGGMGFVSIRRKQVGVL